MQTAERWLKQSLNYEFTDADLFRQALTHRSAPGNSNERLEFLGDAILDFVISEAIYLARPRASEGDLSRLRAHLVSDASLAELALELELGEHLLLGSGEKKSGGHRRESILADALEAIFGAVFLDRGFDAGRMLILACFEERLAALPNAEDLRDPKTRLQEWLQGRGMSLPSYELERISGQAHRQTFEVRCSLADSDLNASGSGSSRRGAEQQAARRLFDALQKAAS
ncbi:MAG: ribonuclease III [Pseudomonadota bacterium]